MHKLVCTSMLVCVRSSETWLLWVGVASKVPPVLYQGESDMVGMLHDLNCIQAVRSDPVRCNIITTNKSKGSLAQPDLALAAWDYQEGRVGQLVLYNYASSVCHICCWCLCFYSCECLLCTIKFTAIVWSLSMTMTMMHEAHDFGLALGKSI